MIANAPADVTVSSMARVNQLLTAAGDTMAKVADCWAATPSEDGGVNVRVVGPIPGVPGEEEWTIWFATRLSAEPHSSKTDAKFAAGGSRNGVSTFRVARMTLIRFSSG